MKSLSSEPSKRLRAGSYQGESARGSIEKNVQRIAAVAKEAAEKEVDVILFPELFLSGYNIPPDELRSLALSNESHEIQQIKRIAKEYCLAIAVGYPELDDSNHSTGLVYNSCILVDGNGNTVLNYRKTHLWDPYGKNEKQVFTPGDSLPITDLTIVRINATFRVGILICFDCEFPEPARVLSLQGAEVVLIPTALAGGPVEDSTPTVAVPSRAAENHIFIVYSNLIGPSDICSLNKADSDQTKQNIFDNSKSLFCGQSAIIGPDGKDLCRASKSATELLVADLISVDFKSHVERNNYLIERRPSLYASIAQSGMSQQQPVIHFNAAGDSPMADSTLAKVKEVLDAEQQFGGYAAADLYSDEIDRVYEYIGNLINCSTDNVALVDSATSAWQRAFYSISLNAGDIVLSCSVEYASNYVSLLQRARASQAEVVVIPSSEDGTVSVDGLMGLLKEYGSRVRVVSITWIPTNGGLVNDAVALGDTIQKHGHKDTLYLLDACQAVGQVEVDVNAIKCHLLSATGRKYLRGPRGTGFLYVSSECLDILREPSTIDLHSAPWNGTSYDILPSAKRFEQWEKNVAALLGLGESIRYLLHDVGQKEAFSKIAFLAEYLRRRLVETLDDVKVWDLGVAEHSRCGIVTFSLPSADADFVKEHLRKLSIFVSVSGPSSTPLDAACRNLPRMVRASLQYFNTTDEIEKFCNVLKNIS